MILSIKHISGGKESKNKEIYKKSLKMRVLKVQCLKFHGLQPERKGRMPDFGFYLLKNKLIFVDFIM